MHRRPLVITALAFVAGILLGRYFISSFSPLFALAALFLIAALALQRASSALSQVTLIVVIIAVGALLYGSSRLPAEALYRQSQGWDYIQGVVASYPANGPERTSFLLKPRDSPGYLQVFYFHPDHAKPLKIDYGDELRLYSKIKQPKRLDGFNYREYLLQRRIWGTVGVWSRREIKLVAHGQGNPLMEIGYRLRERIFGFADRYIPPAGLFKALLFGERGYLGEDIEVQFRDAGVAHVLAVSGLHLGIIIGLFWFALRALHFSAGRIYLVLIPLVGFYLLLVGFRVSLVRAALLFGFLALGWVLSERGMILKKWADPYQGLSAAALVISGWNPGALFDVSFQLSFSATLGIIAFASRFEGLLKKIPFRWLRGLIAVSLAAQLGVIPFIAWHFHRVYLLVILANLLVIPLVTLVLWGGVAFLMIGLLHLPYLPAYLGQAEGWLLDALDRLTGLLAGWGFSYLEISQGELLIVLPAYLLLLGSLIVLFYIRRRAALG